MSPILHSNMKRAFLFSAAILLGATGALKLVSCSMEAQYLASPDPVLRVLSQRQLMLLGACLEIGLAAFIIIHTSDRSKLWLVLWIAAVFLTYRAGLWASGSSAPCPCLGGSLRWIVAHAESLDRLLRCIVAYLMLVSSLFLLSEWRESRAVILQPPEATL